MRCFLAIWAGVRRLVAVKPLVKDGAGLRADKYLRENCVNHNRLMRKTMYTFENCVIGIRIENPLQFM